MLLYQLLDVVVEKVRTLGESEGYGSYVKECSIRVLVGQVESGQFETVVWILLRMVLDELFKGFEDWKKGVTE